MIWATVITHVWTEISLNLKRDLYLEIKGMIIIDLINQIWSIACEIYIIISLLELKRRPWRGVLTWEKMVIILFVLVSIVIFLFDIKNNILPRISKHGPP